MGNQQKYIVSIHANVSKVEEDQSNKIVHTFSKSSFFLGVEN
tara:strand:+ start:258 stop:383 length:126 start_codon:yes stop_codon:yes gene_type:complete